MKRFVITVPDDTPTDMVRGALYTASIKYETEGVYPVQETWMNNHGKNRMTTKQRDKLWELCGRYNVPFREDDYSGPFSGTGLGLKGWVEGWIGGVKHNGHNNQEKTIYVGVSPDGRIHS